MATSSQLSQVPWSSPVSPVKRVRSDDAEPARVAWRHGYAEHRAGPRRSGKAETRDADTLGRCLKMLGATPQCLAAVEAVKSAALEDMAAARRGGAASSEPPPIPPRLGPKHPVPKPTETAGRGEVRDHVLWTKHIRGDDTLKVTLNALSERSQIDLEVDGYRGTWQKMDDGRNGQPTAGLKPLEPARSHWHTLVRNTMGSVVTIALASDAQNAATGRDEQSFEEVWAQIQRNVASGDTIRNWSRHSGYRGNDLMIHAVVARFVDIDSPGAENIQHILREDFSRVHEHWYAYTSGVFARSRLRDITRFSTYVISILHHVLENDRK